MAPSRTATLTDDLASRLADEITSGLLPPGSRLDEASLATRFSVSRTPVREALRQLEATRLIERRPYKGAVVKAIRPAELAQMFEAMAEMEVVCARLAARSMTGPERAELRRFQETMAELVSRGDPEAFSAANFTLHELIYAGSHNDLLEETTRGLRLRLMPFRRAQFRTVGRLARSLDEHEQIISAIERGDSDAAATLMRQHIGLVGAAFDEFSHQPEHIALLALEA